jgi:hypothetical protein
VSLTKKDQDDQQQAELKKTLQKFVKLCPHYIAITSAAELSYTELIERVLDKKGH